MAGQTLVKVRNVAVDSFGRKTELYGTETVITYKSYLILEDRYELIGQCDEDGTLKPGDPNLKPEHKRRQAPQSVEHAVNVIREYKEEPLSATEEFEQIQSEPTPVKRGRKPKEFTA